MKNSALDGALEKRSSMRKAVLFSLPIAGILVIGGLIGLNSKHAPSLRAPSVVAKKVADTSTEEYLHSRIAPPPADARLTFPKHLLNSNRAKELLSELAKLDEGSDGFRKSRLLAELRGLAKVDDNVLAQVLTRLERSDCVDSLRAALLGVVARLGNDLVAKRLSHFIQPEFSEDVRLAAMGALTKAPFSIADQLSRTDLWGDPVDLRTHGRGQLFYEDPEILKTIANLLYTESSPKVLTSMLNALIYQYQEEKVKAELVQRVSEILRSSADETLINASVSFLASVKSTELNNDIARIAAEDPRPSIRSNALRALRLHSTDVFIAVLARTIQSEKDPSVAADSLSNVRQVVIDEEGSLEGTDYILVRDSRALIEQVAFQHPDPVFRLKGMNALIRIVNESLLSPLVRVVQNDPDANVRSRAVYLLGELLESKGTTQQSAGLVERVLREQMLLDKSTDVQESIKATIGGN